MVFTPQVLRNRPVAVPRPNFGQKDRGQELAIQLLLNQFDDDTFRFDVCYSHS